MSGEFKEFGPTSNPQGYGTPPASSLPRLLGPGMEGTRRRMKAMGGGLSVSQGDDRWTTIFTILLHPISPIHTA